jgi:hypothetical protein
LPESWKPWPAQDISHSGLAALVFLPVLLFRLPTRARLPATLLFLAGFISLSGMLHFNPYTGRFFVLLLAGYSLIWGGSNFFSRGYRRWLLTGIITLNVCALLGVVAFRSYVDATSKSQPGGAYYYLSDEDRHTIANTLSGRPLQIITGDSMDALLTGPDIAYPLRYIICPANGDWNQELKRAALKSNWLAIVHGGKKSMPTGPADWHRPGSYTCPEVSLQDLQGSLTNSGWRMYRHNPLVDLWRFH